MKGAADAMSGVLTNGTPIDLGPSQYQTPFARHMWMYRLPILIVKVFAIILSLHVRLRIAKQWTHELQRIEDSKGYAAEPHTLIEREREIERTIERARDRER